MKFISESWELQEKDLVGGKGCHLQKLMQWKAPVPEFFIVTTEAFRYFTAHGSLPLEVEERFKGFFSIFPVIALRSSMTAEDDVDASFAGMFETLLDVREGNWHKAIQTIFSSVHAPRVKEYIDKKKLKTDLHMAVVAQRLIRVEKSGVLFTRSPVVPTSAIAIDAAFGMGEGVVSGLADVDHYQMTRTKELILQKINNPEAVLNRAEMVELLELSLRLEKCHGKASDIEWGILQDQFYIFQIRPITRAFSPLNFFADTNLSESYPGTVSPFTASFVKRAYENVFKESAVLMGASQKKLAQLNPHYENLISCVDDHLYYDLEHYYAVLRALPGGERNIENWHKMIGGKIEDHDIPMHETRPNVIETFSALISLLRISLQRKKYFDPLLSNLDELRNSIESESGGLSSSKETIFYLNQLINRPLGFGLTVVNDVFIMMGLGILTRLLKARGVQNDEIVDLLRTTEGVDSLKPLHHFNSLVSKLSPLFIKKFLDFPFEPGPDPYQIFYIKMKEEGHGQGVSELSSFIEMFGDRSFEELKLESLPIKNDPRLLKDLVTWGKNRNNIPRPTTGDGPSLKISWMESVVLQFTRRSIQTRESTRLWRGKFFHLLRQLVIRLGEQLKSEDPEWRSFTIFDFFSLSHEEWLSYARGEVSDKTVKDLIRSRAKWKEKRQNYPEILIWNKTEELPQFNIVLSPGTSSLQGQGVSSGIAEGIALVLESPDEAFNSELRDFILVTKNTDPAWVYIMSRSQALISEKGSLLSHTAIIGRELQIPTVVGVKSATQMIKTGDRLIVDGARGTVKIL